ncbi:MAG: hypothetical protein ACREQC_13990 [Candidatus Binataceae bacterium]
MPLLESILTLWKEKIGADYLAYKNHVYRMLHFCLYLHEASADERQKLTISAAFHDIGIWSDNTVDYLPPSIAQAKVYLRANGLDPSNREIELVIDMHHKLRRYRDDGTYPLVEIFRRGDLVDFSLGAVTFGIPKTYISEVKAAFPNAGFHRRLLQLSWRQLKRHPLNPAPMMKW